jgi:superfamily II DNA or RNA helicase
VIDEGLDVPKATCLQVLRFTASIRLWRQLIGRVLRPAPGKVEALIIDHTDNWRRLPPPDAAMDWQLNGEVQQPRELRQRVMDEESGEVWDEELPPVEGEEDGAALVEITPEMMAQVHPITARRLINERCKAEIEQRDPRLRRWLQHLNVLEDDTLQLLEPALGLHQGWAQGQMMLRLLLSPKQRLAATKQLQNDWRVM